MESIISYFGTYKPAADDREQPPSFVGTQVISSARGHRDLWQGHRCPFTEALRKYAIPAPVISGLIFSTSQNPASWVPESSNLLRRDDHEAISARTYSPLRRPLAPARRCCVIA